MTKMTKAELEHALNIEEGITRSLKARIEKMQEEFDKQREETRKAARHAARLLKAVQNFRAAERELYAACAEVGDTPDGGKQYGMSWASVPEWECVQRACNELRDKLSAKR